jgi:indolepyruvate ferredoxin oxidoreductase beta subunit
MFHALRFTSLKNYWRHVMSDSVTSIVLVGVGGQGILLACNLLAQAALKAGWDVKTNEVHGMAQRGGSVVAQVRFGQKVHSPLIQKETADFLLALEKLEALRFSEYLKGDGAAIVNAQQIMPLPVATGAAQYPQEIDRLLRVRFPRLTLIDGVSLAKKAGEMRTTNVVLIGALSILLPFDLELWDSVLEENIKARFIKVNQKAFALGRQFNQAHLG